MTEKRRPGDDFEGRLLDQLKAIVADRGHAAARQEAAEAAAPTPAWRRRGPRLALGGGVALAAMAAALIVSAGGDKGSTAYAVEPQDGGGVALKIYNLSDPEGVEQALGEAGIPSQVTYLPPGMTCREPHYQPSMVEMPALPGGEAGSFTGLDIGGGLPGDAMTIGIGNPLQQRELSEVVGQDGSSEADPPTFLVDPSAFRPDQTLVISGAHIVPGSPFDFTLADNPAGGTEMKVRVAEGEVGPCEPVTASKDSTQIRPPEGGWDDAASSGVPGHQ
jgi:hypothetical protein